MKNSKQATKSQRAPRKSTESSSYDNPQITANASQLLTTWTNLIGHSTTLERWRSLAQKGKLPPVLLLVGREGIGKEGLLAYLTALHYCTSGDACGQCTPCVLVQRGNHPEVHWAATSVADQAASKQEIAPVDRSPLLLADAIQIQEHLQLSAGLGGRFRTVVIPDGERLSSQAANRLLKILEEPPANCFIFISTSRLDRFLPTILSRTVKWRIPPPPIEESLAYLNSLMSGLPLDQHILVRLLEHFRLAPGPAITVVKRLLAKSGNSSERPAHRPAKAPVGTPLGTPADTPLGNEEDASTLESEPVSASMSADELMHEAAQILGADSARFLTECESFFADPSVRRAMHTASSWGRQLPLPIMVDTLDRALNQYYRHFIESVPTSCALDPFVIHERRGILSQARQLACRNRISISGQLLLEDVGLISMDQNRT